MVLDRYIFRLWVGSFAAILLIVTGMLLLSRILKMLGYFADKGVDWSIMGTMLMVIVPYFLVLTVPIAFFFAMQGMLIRLHQGSELDALRASGISYPRLLRPIFAVATILWLLLTATTMYWVPEGQRAFQGLLMAIQNVKPAPSFDPQQFNRKLDDLTVYVSGEDEDGLFHGFMLEDTRLGTSVIYVAETARIERENSYLIFMLSKGTRLEGQGEKLRTLEFEGYKVSLNLGELGLLKIPVWTHRVFEMRADELWKAAYEEGRPDAVAEWNRRLLLPTTIMILMLFALPLSFTPKRTGKTGSYLTGVALMLLIYNAQIVLHTHVQNGNILWWLMWLEQTFFFALAIWVFRRVCDGKEPLWVAFQSLFKKIVIPSKK